MTKRKIGDIVELSDEYRNANSHVDVCKGVVKIVKFYGDSFEGLVIYKHNLPTVKGAIFLSFSQNGWDQLYKLKAGDIVTSEGRLPDIFKLAVTVDQHPDSSGYGSDIFEGICIESSNPSIMPVGSIRSNFSVACYELHTHHMDNPDRLAVADSLKIEDDPSRFLPGDIVSFISDEETIMALVIDRAMSETKFEACILIDTINKSNTNKIMVFPKSSFEKTNLEIKFKQKNDRI